MNNSVKSDDELIALLERTMHHVAVSAPDMEFSTTARSQRWMASAAAATVLVVGVGAAALALTARHDASGRLSPGAQTTEPATTVDPVPYTTMPSVIEVTTLPFSTDPGATIVPPALSGSIHEKIGLLLPGLTQIGFPNSEYSTDAQGVTTVSAFSNDQTQTITVTITPGTPVGPESHVRPLIGVVEQTADRLQVKYDSNTGWKYTLLVQRTGTSPLPTPTAISDVLYTSDP